MEDRSRSSTKTRASRLTATAAASDNNQPPSGPSSTIEASSNSNNNRSSRLSRPSGRWEATVSYNDVSRPSADHRKATSPSASSGVCSTPDSTATTSSSSTYYSPLTPAPASLSNGRPRRSNTSDKLSDVSSTFDHSLRGVSPPSGPSTPATSVSTSSTVLNVSSLSQSASGSAKRSRDHQDSDEGTPFSPVSTSERAVKKNKGKGKASSSEKNTEAKPTLVAPARSKKRALSSSNNQAFVPKKNHKNNKRQELLLGEHSQHNSGTSSGRYNLRSTSASMTPKKEPLTTSPPGTAKGRQSKNNKAGNGGVGPSRYAVAGPSTSPSSSSSCNAVEDVDVDDDAHQLSANKEMITREHSNKEESKRKRRGKRESAAAAEVNVEETDAENKHIVGDQGEEGKDREENEDGEEADEQHHHQNVFGEEDEVDGQEDGEEGPDQFLDEETRRVIEMDEEDEEDDDEDDEGQYDDEAEDPYRDGAGGMDFGLNLRAMAGYASGLSGRFRSLLKSIKSRKDPSTQLVALQELAELLSISNEDMLAGYFPTVSFVTELIYIMGGPKPPEPSEGKQSGGATIKTEDEAGEDGDEGTAIAIAAGLEDSGEMKLLACRCLANLIEAMPYTAHSIVTHGAVPVLNAKLTEIDFIDLAEQVLQTLEKISAECPSAIIKEDGGMRPMLEYLDFFNIHVQRTAMTAAANCCRKLGPDSFPKIKDVMPIIQNVLGYSDQRLVESACRCVVRAVDSYRHNADLLEQLLTDELIGAINAILLPTNASGAASSSSTTVNTATYTEVLKALSTAARVSPSVAVGLLKNNVVETLYHLLTGSPAPTEDGTGGKGPASVEPFADDNAQSEVANANSAASAALAVVSSAGTESVGMADVAVLQNLAHRPKEQVQEALSLVAELLPPLPRDGIFDQRKYSERAYQRVKSKLRSAQKAQKKVENTSSSSEKSSAPGSGSEAKERSEENEIAEVPAEMRAEMLASNDSEAPPTAPTRPEKAKSEKELAKEQAQAKRVDTLRNRQSLVKRFTQLVLPTLVEVYAASVFQHVRSKALYGILKIVSFVEPQPLKEVLDNVPLASFVAAVLSTRDHPALVQGALQLVELLTSKMADVYGSLLRREGVMWEIDDIASKEPVSKAASSRNPEKAKAVPLVLPSGASLSSTTSTDAVGGSADNEKPRTSNTGLSRLLASSSAAPSYALHVGNGVSAMRSHATSSATLSSQPNSTPPSELEDANIWRARVLQIMYAPEASQASSGGAEAAGRALDDIKALVVSMEETNVDSSEAQVTDTLMKVADLFSKPENPISSFELLRSGLVNGLYSFAVGDSEALPQQTRRKLLSDALLSHQNEGGSSAAAVLIRRLQETLSRLENVEITTAINSGFEETRRSPTANVARQIRLRLVADDNETGDIPQSCTNIVVTIHAIASFQSLNDYLRPKIAASHAASSGGSSSGPASSRLSSVLAAFASSAGIELPPNLAAKEGTFSIARDGKAHGDVSDLPTGSSNPTPKEASQIVSPSKKNKTEEEKEGEGKEKEGEHDESEESSSKAQRNRRRSSRLSGKAQDSHEKGDREQDRDDEPGEGVGDVEEDVPATSTSNGSKVKKEEGGDFSDEALTRRLVEDLLQSGGGPEGLEDEDGGMSEDDFGEEVIGDGAVGGTSMGSQGEDKTINLDVAQDGSKVEAKTPDGTRVATPSNELSKPISSSSSTGQYVGSGPLSSSSAKSSYSSALQKPVDWHLEFEMDGKPIPLDSTIYGAIHHSESNSVRQGLPPRYIWAQTYSIKYRKVAGPAPGEGEAEGETGDSVHHTPEPLESASASAALPPSVAEDAPYAKVLQMLRVLHDLHAEWREFGQHGFGQGKVLNESAFVNNKLTAKLSRQLEEPMIVASSCMPRWSLDLPRSFSFLFPFETRYAFLQSTSFGYHRLINRWQNQQSREQGSSGGASSLTSRHDDSLALLGRLTRQKVRISRNSILASAFKVFELYGTNASLLEVEYFEEVGTGLGPTLEFYSLVSKEFARKDLAMWRDEDDDGQGEKGHSDGSYVVSPNGLFPAPIQESEVVSSTGKARTYAFRILGQFVAKALFDSRIIDINFNPTFMRTVLDHRVPETLATLSTVDSHLARSLEKLRGMSATEVDSLGLDFTLPGNGQFELHRSGKEEGVTAANVERYVAEVTSYTLNEGIKPFVRAFRQGFDRIFAISSMSSFTPDELVMLFGNTDEDWSEPTLLSSVKPDHGYNADSASFRDVIHIMSTFSISERREFLQWLTGSPKLPIGGFAGLRPQLTIVKRPPEPNTTADQTLPSVMTCVNFCKLPPFSNRDIMRQRLLLAMREGQASFHLS